MFTLTRQLRGCRTSAPTEMVCWAWSLCMGWSLLTAPALGAGIYGTMSNFDIYNTTPDDAYGAEIELEDIHLIDIGGTFPSHFKHESRSEIVENGVFRGVRIKYSGFDFESKTFLSPAEPQSTNGHSCVNLTGCEHFGFGVSAQPTAAKFYWLNKDLNRIDNNPVPIPYVNWSYQNGNVVARVEAPEVERQRPDSIWMKVYKTEIPRPVGLDELMSDDPVVPEDPAEVESEWELLEGGKFKEHGDRVREDGKSVVRRYEFFRYTGGYDDEHEPTTTWQVGEPPVGELGAFIAANMVAANLIPDPQDFFPGDANADGVVDISDFVVLKNNFGKAGNFAQGDFSRDGKVDINDFTILRKRFGRQQVHGAAAVPEPATWVLVLTAASGLVWLKRRQLK